MATLMEKDVLLEFVSAGLSEISRAKDRGDTTEELSDDDRYYLVDMRHKLYTSSEKDWNFKKTVYDIRKIYDKYKLR